MAISCPNCHGALPDGKVCVVQKFGSKNIENLVLQLGQSALVCMCGLLREGRPDYNMVY